jgi:TPR repeat protein
MKVVSGDSIPKVLGKQPFGSRRGPVRICFTFADKAVVRWYRLGVKAVAIFLLVCGSALADLASCRAAFDKETFDVARKECSAAAEQGNDAAQNVLGVMYVSGKGVPQDYAEAARWFRLSADQGNAFAQFNLGDVYALGQGIAQDYV